MCSSMSEESPVRNSPTFAEGFHPDGCASHPQKLLGISQAEIRQKCQERVKELEELKTAVDSLKVMMMMCSLRTPLHEYNTIKTTV